MLNMEQWFSKSFREITESAFITSPHRRAPESLRRVANLHYYSVPVSSGVSRSILIVPQSENTRSNAFVFLFHGMGDDCIYPHWHWIEIFVRKGFSVFSVDWDGHGAGNATHLDFQQASRSMPLILQKLYGESGDPLVSNVRDRPRCFLMGHSAGGALVLIASTRPDIAELVHGAVVVSPAIALAASSRFKGEALAYLSPKAWIRDFWSKIPYYGLSGLIPAFGNHKRKQFPIRLRVGINYVEQLREFVHETFTVRRVLRNVKVPVLWLHGHKDKLVPAELAGELMSEISSGLFCHMEGHRDHTLMAFSNQVPLYAARFVETFSQVS